MLKLISTLLGCLCSISFATQPVSFATASADTITTIINQHVTLTGEHFAFLFNNSYLTVPYIYYFQLCAPGNGCSIRSYNILLNPHVGVNIYGFTVLDALFTRPGVYLITATTGINGGMDNITSTGTSIADVLIH